MKLSKPFKACLKGQIYPSSFKAGDECPPELEATARAVGALEAPKPKPKKAR